MLYLITGKEEFLREELVAQLKARMRNLPMGEHNIDEFPSGAPIRDVIGACDAFPFLCEKRMVIGRGIVSQASKGRRSRGRRASEDQPQAGMDELSAYLPNMPASTHLLLVEEDEKALADLASTRSDTVKRDFPRLRDDALPRWIMERASKARAKISARAAAVLAQLVGSELRALDTEIGKLATYVSEGDTIDTADVHLLVAGAGPSIFELHDAVAERRPAAAMAAARSLMERGTDPAELLAQLAALVRRLLVVKELVAEHRAPAREAAAFGVTSSPYLLQKLQRQAAGLSSADLDRAYALLCRADLAMKTGQMEPELIIEMAVAALVGVAPSGIFSSIEGDTFAPRVESALPA